MKLVKNYDDYSRWTQVIEHFFEKKNIYSCSIFFIYQHIFKKTIKQDIFCPCTRKQCLNNGKHERIPTKNTVKKKLDEWNLTPLKQKALSL